jgi:hypothetical protein
MAGWKQSYSGVEAELQRGEAGYSRMEAELQRGGSRLWQDGSRVTAG